MHVTSSYKAGMQFANAKAWLEAANRGSIHASLLILFALGGWLVTNNHMPLRVMLTGIGFTYSLLYATQARPFCATFGVCVAGVPRTPLRGSPPRHCACPQRLLA